MIYDLTSLSHVPPQQICNILDAQKDLYTVLKIRNGTSQNTAELRKAGITMPIKQVVEKWWGMMRRWMSWI